MPPTPGTVPAVPTLPAGRDPAPRLSRATLDRSAPAVIHPPGPAAPDASRIVHLGLGAFSRAFLAPFTEDAAGTGAPWPILGVSLRHPDQRDRLRPQDHLFLTLEHRPAGAVPRVVGCLADVLVAPEDPAAVVAALADPRTVLVTLTVTEKGYCHDPATGRLDPAHPDIVHDLAHPDAPRSAPGFLLAGLRRRRTAGIAPFAVLSCDNLPSNGRLLAALLRDLAAHGDPVVADRIAAEVDFPCSMVDRIVPATTPDTLALAEQLSGLRDEAPVAHESFRQWVIEDRFRTPRPAWERAGALLVGDVAPFEHMKLRLLNGAHSALGYLGVLAGRETIADCMADHVLAAFAERFWRECRAVVPRPPGINLSAYTASLARRFADPAIRHRTAQIARDGSQKLPQRLLGPIRDCRARGLPFGHLALAVAAWMRHLDGKDERGAALEALHDPLAAALRERLSAAGNAPDARVRTLLGLAAVFGTDLPADDAVVSALAAAYAALRDRGVREAAATAGER